MAEDNDTPAVNENITQVLEASNYYQVLGIDPEEASDLSLLRKRYLQRSVQVHPDKNDGRPEATQAFQKVTHAYNVLSDDDARAHYERYGTDSPNGEEGDGETYYAGSSSRDPSFQEAAFVFASVASMMGGAKAGAAADMANAMYFAEAYLSGERDLSDGKGKAQAAMAAGSGLRVVSNVARSVGFTQSAKALDSAATCIQVAGIGAMVADTPAVKKALQDKAPAVQRTLEAGGQRLAQLGGGFVAARDALRKRGGTGGAGTDASNPNAKHQQARASAMS